MNDRTTLDPYSTPHSNLLHVIERYHVTDGGRTLQVDFTVDDPKAFTMPWSGIAHDRKARGDYEEFVCAENNMNIWTGKTYPVPAAGKADF